MGNARPSFTALVVPPKGRALLCLWAALPGALAAPFAFWRGVWAGVVLCLLWGALLAAVYVRACSFAAALEGDMLAVYAGVAFPVRRAAVCRAVTSVRLVRTPLARLAGVSLLAVETPGLRLWLPAVPVREAGQLAAFLESGA